LPHLKRPSGALIVACVALFVSLSGGAYAATTFILPVGSVGSRQIKTGAVTTSKLSPWVNRMLNDVATGHIKGLQSPNGGTGAAGATGATGPTGATGATGASGAQGAQGNQGPAGQNGTDGTNGTDGANGADASMLGYEVSNGASWSLSGLPLAIAADNPSYEDAAVLVDLGPASQFNGITIQGSGPISDDVWITNGSEAYSFGSYSTSGVNFTYGSGSGSGSSETFYMEGNSADPNYGQTLTAQQVAQDYAGYEVYAWVGLYQTGTPSSTVNGTVTSVNGTPVNANLSLSATSARAGS
jgi:hypothetical protein